MRRFTRGLTATLIAAGCGLTTQLPAQAAPDNTPPVLNTPVTAHFVTGAQLTEFDLGDVFYNVPMAFEWSATDASGVAYYDVWKYYAGDDPAKVLEFTDETSAEVTGSDYDDQQGGGSFAITNWSVQAHDNQGNSVERAIRGSNLTVTQDDGSQTNGHATTDVAVSYRGAWQTSVCACFADGTTHKSTARNAATVIRVRVPAAKAERAVGIVMETAPGRGRARIVVDGVSQGVVDTLAGTARHQVIVWQDVLSQGLHTVRVVNLATAGRARVDFDAVVVSN